MLIATLLAAGGLLFAFDHATIAGKLVLSLLAVVSIFSWSIMITKLRVIGNKMLVSSRRFGKIDNRCVYLRRTPGSRDRRYSTCIAPAVRK